MLAKRALSGHRRNAGGSLRKELVAVWKKMHRGVRNATLPKFPPVPASRVRACFFAGFCVCQQHDLCRMVKSCRAQLRILFQKGSTGRHAYDSGSVVWKISGGANQEKWYHVSFGNLNSYQFALLPLEVDADHYGAPFADDAALVALKHADCSLTLGFRNIWEVFRDCDFSDRWFLSLFRLHSSEIERDQFIPAECFVEPLSGQQPVVIWEGSANPRRLLAVADADAGADDDGHWELAPLHDGGEVDVGPALGGAGLAMELAEEWAVIEEPDDAGPDVGGGGLGVHVPDEGAAGVELEPVGEVPAPLALHPPPLPPLPVADGVGAEEGAGGGGGGHGHGAPYPRWDVEGFGRLVFDPRINSMAAHCDKHRSCRVNRTLNPHPSKEYVGRPLGFLVAWLRSAETCETKEAHFAQRDATHLVEACGMHARQEARVWLQAQPHLADALLLERARQLGEAAEPHFYK
jgi:hypothetical protein